MEKSISLRPGDFMDAQKSNYDDRKLVMASFANDLLFIKVCGTLPSIKWF